MSTQLFLVLLVVHAQRPVAHLLMLKPTLLVHMWFTPTSSLVLLDPPTPLKCDATRGGYNIQLLSYYSVYWYYMWLSAIEILRNKFLIIFHEIDFFVRE
jgi:hypothetical protein